MLEPSSEEHVPRKSKKKERGERKSRFYRNAMAKNAFKYPLSMFQH